MNPLHCRQVYNRHAVPLRTRHTRIPSSIVISISWIWNSSLSLLHLFSIRIFLYSRIMFFMSVSFCCHHSLSYQILFHVISNHAHVISNNSHFISCFIIVILIDLLLRMPSFQNMSLYIMLYYGLYWYYNLIIRWSIKIQHSPEVIIEIKL